MIKEKELVSISARRAGVSVARIGNRFNLMSDSQILEKSTTYHTGHHRNNSGM